MGGRGGNTFVVPLHKVPTALTGDCDDSYVSVKLTPFFYTKGQTRKKFSILNTHATRGMVYRIRGCSALNGGAMVRPKTVISDTTLPGGLTDPEIETITDPYVYMDVQVKNQSAGQDAEYAVDTELVSV